MKTAIARLMAVFVTLTAISMGAVAAWDRGGNEIDRMLFVALSVAIIAAVHLLPALSSRPAAWVLWISCLLCAIYGHLVFFTHASIRASEYQGQHSALVIATGKQIEAARDALGGISARPIAVVATELASTKSWKQRYALRAELAEAKRAAVLHDELINLVGAANSAQVAEGDDPVTTRLAKVTGSSEAGIALVIGLCLSISLELLGTLLWSEVLRRPDEVLIVNNTQYPPADSITELKAAILSGKCKSTVSGIRVFLRCSQDRAVKLRRALSSIIGEEISSIDER